jgi:hypothetical protein
VAPHCLHPAGACFMTMWACWRSARWRTRRRSTQAYRCALRTMHCARPLERLLLIIGFGSNAYHILPAAGFKTAAFYMQAGWPVQLTSDGCFWWPCRILRCGWLSTSRRLKRAWLDQGLALRSTWFMMLLLGARQRHGLSIWHPSQGGRGNEWLCSLQAGKIRRMCWRIPVQ